MTPPTERVLLPDLAATEAFGRRLGEALGDGMIVGLEGPLGAGKTTLVQAIARGLGVPASEYVRSPTFAIMNEYQGKSRVYHMDLYRIGDPGEVDHLGWDEYVGASGVALIEWIDRAPHMLGDDALRIRLDYGDAPESRIAAGEARGERHRRAWAHATEGLARA